MSALFAQPVETFTLEVSRCDCTGPDTIVFDHWGHVVAYHLPQECLKSRRVTVVLERSNYRPRTGR